MFKHWLEFVHLKEAMEVIKTQFERLKKHRFQFKIYIETQSNTAGGENWIISAIIFLLS